MPSPPGAMHRIGRPGALAPEPTRARAPDEPVPAPALGGLGEGPSTDLMAPTSDPPPPFGDLPSRDERESLPPPSAVPVEAFDEFEDAPISSESTRVEENDALAEQSTAILEDAPKLPFLFVEAGKDRGKEFILQEGETSIGRGIDNDVILADVSVSRRHFRLISERGQITLRDLGSGNGTQVNGRRAHVEALADGDRIELGETILVLRLPGADIRADAHHATHENDLPDSGELARPVGAGAFTPQIGPPLPRAGVSTDELPSPRDGRTQSIVLPRQMLFAAAAAVAIVGSVIGAGVVLLLPREPEPVALPIAPSTPVGVPLPALGVPTRLPDSPPAPIALAPPVAPAPAPLPSPPTTEPSPAEAAAGVVPASGAAAVVVPASGAVPPPATVADPAVVPPGPAPEREEREVRSGASRRRTSEPGGADRAAAIAAYRAGDFLRAASLAREASRSAPARDRAALERLAGEIDEFARLHPRIASAGTSYERLPVSDATRAIRIDRAVGAGAHTRTFAAGYAGWLLDRAEASFAGDPAGACRQVRSAAEIGATARTRSLEDRCAERARGMIEEARRAERGDPARARDLYRGVLRMVPGTAEAAAAQRAVDALGRSRMVDEDE